MTNIVENARQKAARDSTESHMSNDTKRARIENNYNPLLSQEPLAAVSAAAAAAAATTDTVVS